MRLTLKRPARLAAPDRGVAPLCYGRRLVCFPGSGRGFRVPDGGPVPLAHRRPARFGCKSRVAELRDRGVLRSVGNPGCQRGVAARRKRRVRIYVRQRESGSATRHVPASAGLTPRALEGAPCEKAQLCPARLARRGGSNAERDSSASFEICHETPSPLSQASFEAPQWARIVLLLGAVLVILVAGLTSVLAR